MRHAIEAVARHFKSSQSAAAGGKRAWESATCQVLTRGPDTWRVLSPQRQAGADSSFLFFSCAQAECMYLVEEGAATATIDGESVFKYGAGGFFGELALLRSRCEAPSH